MPVEFFDTLLLLKQSLGLSCCYAGFARKARIR